MKSRSGYSLTTTDLAITAKNIELFRPSTEVIAQAKQLFEAAGFSVVYSGITLTLLGNLVQFIQLFGSEWTEGKIVIPENLRNIVEQVVFPKQSPTYFDK